MARNAGRRTVWRRGSDGVPEMGQRDVQPVAHRKDATSDEVLTFIDSLHQGNLPVQPVARSSGTERFRRRLLPTRAGTSFEGTSRVLLETGLENPIIRRGPHEV